MTLKVIHNLFIFSSDFLFLMLKMSLGGQETQLLSILTTQICVHIVHEFPFQTGLSPL